jgi:phage shock protein C
VTDRLYRSPTDRVITGVAGGLAVYLNLDPSLVRVAWVLLAILSGGIFILVYFVMMIVVPLPPVGWVPRPRGGSGPAWPSGGSGWQAGSTTPGAPPAGTSPGAVPGWQTGEGTAWGQAPGGLPESGWGQAPRVDSGNAGIVFGAVLVLLGAWFLVDRYIDIDWNLLWPVVVIGLGVVLMLGAMRRNRTPGD